jgi:hypothetical protein
MLPNRGLEPGGYFALSGTVIEQLVTAAATFDYSVFIIRADDVVPSDPRTPATFKRREHEQHSKQEIWSGAAN